MDPLAPVPLITARGLKKYFPARAGVLNRARRFIKAVNDVSFNIHAGETLALVGESGCGKTTVGRMLLRLIDPTDGSILVDGHDITNLKPSQLGPFRRRLQIIFQDPYSSLNPRMTAGTIIGEAIRVHQRLPKSQWQHKVDTLLERVGLDSSARDRYPHEFSGGQRQRIGIARALAVDPEFVVCDEAVSALDVSVQAQILSLLDDLKHELRLAYLFITHDLNVVRQIADRVLVMYLGRVVEVASVERLFDKPMHPYTRCLLSANPIPDPLCPPAPIVVEGEVPSALDPPNGCPFHTRCPDAMDRCRHEVPAAVAIGAAGHGVACHLYSDS